MENLDEKVVKSKEAIKFNDANMQPDTLDETIKYNLKKDEALGQVFNVESYGPNERYNGVLYLILRQDNDKFKEFISLFEKPAEGIINYSRLKACEKLGKNVIIKYENTELDGIQDLKSIVDIRYL